MKPQVFNFYDNSVRFVMINNQKYAVGADATSAVGYKNSRDALNKHVKDKYKFVSRIATPAGEREMTLISEPGLYQLAAQSKLPKAEKFQDWLFETVLPQINATGEYNIQKDSYMIEDPAERARAWAKEFETKRQFQLENEELKKEREANAKWIELAKSISKSKENLMIGTLATFLEQAGITGGRNTLFKRLRRDGYLIKSGKQKNEPTSKGKKLGLFKLIETPYYKDGERHQSKQTVATHISIAYFIEKYGKKENADKLKEQIRLL